MIRTQIQLEERQAEALRKLASEQNVSVAALIRRAVDQSLLLQGEGEARYRRAVSALRRLRPEKRTQGDVSRRHDDYLAEDLKDW